MLTMAVEKVLLAASVLLVISGEINSVNSLPDIGANVTRILNSLLERYDKRFRPNYGGPAVEVGVTMHIIGIHSISESQMDFTSDFYFRQMWKDNRLSFRPEGGINHLVVGAEVADKIWVPDTFFANEKVASFHDATTPNTYLSISSSGEVKKSIRLTVTASCPMNLQYFPMDSQLCTIEIESYGSSMADIIYIWAKGPGSVGLSDNLELPQFKIVGHKQLRRQEVLSTGNYSRLVCEIELARSYGYYIIQAYMPAILIVVMSWVSFWVNRNAITARVIIGLITSLAILFLWSIINSNTPKISYIKSIDKFLAICFAMAFASLLEFATVAYLCKQTEGKIHLKKLNNDCEDSEAESYTRCGKITKAFYVSPNKLDVYSRVVFPVCFLVFNLSYWL